MTDLELTADIEKRRDGHVSYSTLCQLTFETAASRLGISAVQLAEALQDGGIVDMIEAFRKIEGEAYRGKPINCFTIAETCRAILAKIRKEGE